MRVFTRIVFICNICFIIAVIMRRVEMSMRAKGNFDGAIKFQPLESTLVVLGYSAILLNFIFVAAALILILKKKIYLLPKWLVIINFIMLPIQVYYFFFSSI